MMSPDTEGGDSDLYLSDKTGALLMLNKEERKLIKELAKNNVPLMNFRFDNEGAKILLSY